MRVDRRESVMFKYLLNLFFFSLTVQVLAGPGCSCLKHENMTVEDSVIQKDEQRSATVMDRVTVAYASSASSYSSELAPVAPRNSPSLAPVSELPKLSDTDKKNDFYPVLPKNDKQGQIDRACTPQSMLVSPVLKNNLTPTKNSLKGPGNAVVTLSKNLHESMPTLNLDDVSKPE